MKTILKLRKNGCPSGPQQQKPTMGPPTIAVFLFFLLLLLCSLPLTSTEGAEGVLAGGWRELRLVNNGYEGLVVAISDHVPRKHCSQVVRVLRSVLTELSEVLWRTTGGRASLREVTVALPGSWRSDAAACPQLHPLFTSAAPTHAHIRITTPHPVYGGSPWAQQSRGCGHQGDYIQLGDNVLTASTNNTYIHTAQLLMAEWAKFRWGIFEERGYPNDPLYPATYRDPKTKVPRPNTCMAHVVTPLPFCATSAHVPEAPTKHNAQCFGRPAWDVIRQSQDFTDKRNGPLGASEPLIPSIKFMQETSARIVLLVEETAVMNLQRRWEFIRKAVRRVVVYDVPDGVHVALIVFSNVVRTVAPLLKMDSFTDVRQRLGSSLPRNPSRVPERNKCIICGFKEAIRILGTNTSGATVILLTTGKIYSHRDVEEMMQLASEHGMRIDTIFYPLTDKQGSITTTHDLKRLAAETHGSSFTVMDEGVGNDSKVNMMVALMDALLSAIRHVTPHSTPGAPMIIHSTAYPGGIASMSTGSFVLDDSLGTDVRFCIYYYDLNHVGNTVQLTAPSGQTFASINTQEEDGDANVIFINIPNAERGLWRYRVENRADSHQGLHIQVTAKESLSREVSLRLWTSSTSNIVDLTDPTSPVVIYAELKEGLVPIIKAKVVAKLKRLGSNTSGNNYLSVMVDLLDNGFGDPDITGGDGVYSRYLPTLHGGSGHFELSVTANNNDEQALAAVSETLTFGGRHSYVDISTHRCCGNTIKYEHTRPVAAFQRSYIYGVLDVVSSPRLDIKPPSRIMDLRASVNLTTGDVEIHWTAPGGDFDKDRARHYEGVLAYSWSNAMKFKGRKINKMPVPALVGTPQKVLINVSHYDQIFYAVVRAVDAVGNHGDVSNVLSLYVPRPPTPPGPFSSPQPTSSSRPPSDRSHDVTQPVRAGSLTLEDMAIIIGSLSGFILVIIIIVAFCYCHILRQRQRVQKVENEKMASNQNSLLKTNSTSVLNPDDEIDSADVSSQEKDVMMQEDDSHALDAETWALNKLLQGHSTEDFITKGSMSVAPGPSSYCHILPESYPDVTLTGTLHYLGPKDQFHTQSPNSSRNVDITPPPPLLQSDPPPPLMYSELPPPVISPHDLTHTLHSASPPGYKYPYDSDAEPPYKFQTPPYPFHCYPSEDLPELNAQTFITDSFPTDTNQDHSYPIGHGSYIVEPVDPALYAGSHLDNGNCTANLPEHTIYTVDPVHNNTYIAAGVENANYIADPVGNNIYNVSTVGSSDYSVQPAIYNETAYTADPANHAGDTTLIAGGENSCSEIQSDPLIEQPSGKIDVLQHLLQRPETSLSGDPKPLFSSYCGSVPSPRIAMTSSQSVGEVMSSPVSVSACPPRQMVPSPPVHGAIPSPISIAACPPVPVVASSPVTMAICPPVSEVISPQMSADKCLPVRTVTSHSSPIAVSLPALGAISPPVPVPTSSQIPVANSPPVSTSSSKISATAAYQPGTVQRVQRLGSLPVPFTTSSKVSVFDSPPAVVAISSPVLEANVPPVSGTGSKPEIIHNSNSFPAGSSIPLTSTTKSKSIATNSKLIPAASATSKLVSTTPSSISENSKLERISLPSTVTILPQKSLETKRRNVTQV